MNPDVLRVFTDNKKLLSPEAKELIESNDKPFEFANLVLNHIASSTIFITKADVEAVIVGDKPIFESTPTQVARNKNIPDIVIDYNTDISGKSITTGTINDFASLIQSRYNKLAHIIECTSFGRPSTIASSKNRHNTTVRLIGIIYEVRVSKNGNILLTIEDMSGTTTVLVNKNSEYITWQFIRDEVIGLQGQFNEKGDMFFPSRIVRPEIPRDHRWEPMDTSSKVLLMSDLHMGSKMFQKTGWKNTMDWLKSHHDIENVNYVIIPGDVVDGVGVYPDQVDDLEQTDIYDQYKTLAESLKEIPDGINVVISPGNHDAVRLAEPQPIWKKCFTEDFDSSITMVGNPISFEIEGKRFYSYHGKGIDQLVSTIREVTYDDPTVAMMYMAKFRHFCPTYGGKVPLCPEKIDYLCMDKVPDAIVAGHVHKSQSAIYNGVRLIQCGCEMGQSDFQAQHNLVPDVCQTPILSMKNGVVKFYDFTK